MNTHSPLQGRISQEQVDHFTREGYVVPTRPIFSEEKHEKLKKHFENKLSALPLDQRPEGMDVPHFTDPALFEWLFADEILDLVEPIIGPDIALFSSHFICKPKGNGKRVPWHEDSACWQAMLPATMEVVTVWFAIDPARRVNRCMPVIPHPHNTEKRGSPTRIRRTPQKHFFPPKPPRPSATSRRRSPSNPTTPACTPPGSSPGGRMFRAASDASRSGFSRRLTA